MRSPLPKKLRSACALWRAWTPPGLPAIGSMGRDVWAFLIGRTNSCDGVLGGRAAHSAQFSFKLVILAAVPGGFADLGILRRSMERGWLESREVGNTDGSGEQATQYCRYQYSLGMTLFRRRIHKSKGHFRIGRCQSYAKYCTSDELEFENVEIRDENNRVSRRFLLLHLGG